MSDTPTITFVGWLAYEHLNGIFEGDAMLVDGPVLEPRPELVEGERYELHPVGGLHVDRVPCGECEATGDKAGHDCPSCVDGMTWPLWVYAAAKENYSDTVTQVLDALRAAQTGDTEWHTNYNTGERCNCGLAPCYVDPDSEPMITGVDPDNGSG